jgi:hypothetical protein
MGLSRETEFGKSLVHLSLSICLHNLHSRIPLLLCQNSVMLCHVVATFIFILLETHLLNAKVIHFPENSFTTELLNFPQQRVVQSSYCLLHHTLIENQCWRWQFATLWGFYVPKSVNSLYWLYLPLYTWLQSFTWLAWSPSKRCCTPRRWYG